jgi:hypothetical protein
MLVSTFELLLKPQLPKLGGLTPELTKKLKGLSRTVLQGYFLTIANPNKYDVEVALKFTSVDGTNPFEKTITFFDATGVNDPGKLNQDGTITLKKIVARDTGLFLLQPDVTFKDGELFRDGVGFELRGYVEIALTKPTPSEDTALLLTAEHRGTFFKNTEMLTSKGLEDYVMASDLNLDQIAYQLPMASGGSKFTFVS